MYYITDKHSLTGKKIQAIENEVKKCNQKSADLAKELGADQWRPMPFPVAGGISALVLENPDMKIWKKVKDTPNMYTPRANTKEGKKIQLQMKELPTVSREQLNQVVGWDEGWSVIGVNFNTEGRKYGIDILEKWEIKMPDDCIEVTSSEYKKHIIN